MGSRELKSEATIKNQPYTVISTSETDFLIKENLARGEICFN